MVPPPPADARATAIDELGREIIRIGHALDRFEPGAPERLPLLRRQADLSDAREALRSSRG